MKLLVIDSKHAHGLDLVLRASEAGHDVVWFIPEDHKTIHVGEGLAHIVRDFGRHLKWADLVFVTDNTTYLRNVDAARKEGCTVIGATSESAEWELDRCLGMEILERNGIGVPEYREFSNYDEAITYVKKQDRPLVSKPSGDADKALSYVSKHPADLVYMLNRWKANKTLKGTFILQEKVDGIEMAVGGWFGPGGFNQAWCENFEFKKLCTGDLGCSTGEQGTVLRYVKDSKLARKLLMPLEEELAATGHTGYVDVNAIIDKSGVPWPLEFTMRPGWPTLQMQQTLHHGDPVEWLIDLAHGDDAHNCSYKDVVLGVVLSIPDYPYSHITRKDVCGVPIYIDLDDWSNIHFCECCLGEAPDIQTMKPTPMICTAGDYVLVVTGSGKTVQEAKREAYHLLTKIDIPNSPMWRVDIGDRLKKQLPELQKHGYATGLTFAAAKPTPKEEKGEIIGGLKIIYV